MTNVSPPRIDGYRYLRTLGRGSTATVHLYRQERTGRQVAVKVSAGPADPTMVNAFRAETNALTRLSGHPYVLATYGMGVSDDDRSYIILEYAPGGTLKDALRARTLNVQEMLELGVTLASALATAHRAGIVHRDIKTSNVLFTTRNTPALADFGVATGSYDHMSTGYSLPWAPPETLRSEGGGDEQADVYSLAAVLYASLVGMSPFEYGYHPRTAQQLADSILLKPLPPIARADVPQNVYLILAAAMNRDADLRPSAFAFARELQRAQFELYGNVTPLRVDGADPYPASIPRMRRNRQVVLAGRAIGEKNRSHARFGKQGKRMLAVLAMIAALAVLVVLFVACIAPNADSAHSGTSIVTDSLPMPTGQSTEDSLTNADVVPPAQQLAGTYVSTATVRFTWVNPSPQDGDIYMWSLESDSSTHTTHATELTVHAGNDARTCIQVSIVRVDRAMSEPSTACVVP